MRKKLIYLVLLGTTIYQGAYQAHGADAALKYLQGSGTPPSLAPRDCSAACNENACVADLNAKNYRCFKGCSQHTGVAQIMSCANRQFISFINDLHAQLNILNQQNNAQDKIGRQKMKLGGKKIENAELQQRFDALEIKFNTEKQRLAGLVTKNQQLHDRLADANANINQKAVHIDALNAEIVANEEEIKGLKVELDEIKVMFEQLMASVEEFVGPIFGESMRQMFDNLKKVEATSDSLRKEINAGRELIKKYKNELPEFILSKENEINELVRRMQENIALNEEFIKDIRNLVNVARSGVEKASSTVSSNVKSIGD